MSPSRGLSLGGRGPLSNEFWTTLRYTQQQLLTDASGFAHHAFNLSSVYDPDYTGTGHQPMGRDQLSALYKQYRVYRVAWRVTYLGPHANQTQNQYFACRVHSGATVYSNLVTFLEADGASGPVVGPLVGAATDTPSIAGSIVLRNLSGQTAAEYEGDDDTKAAVGASPSSVKLLQVATQHSDASATEVGGYFLIQLFMRVKFFDLITLGGS